MQKKIFLSASDWWLLGEKIWEKEQLKNVYELYEWAISRTVSVILWESCCNFKGRFSIYIYRGELLFAILTFSISCEKKILTRSERKNQEAIYVWKKNDNLYKWSLLNSSTYKLFLHLKIEIKKLRRKCKEREM